MNKKKMNEYEKLPLNIKKGVDRIRKTANEFRGMVLNDIFHVFIPRPRQLKKYKENLTTADPKLIEFEAYRGAFEKFKKEYLKFYHRERLQSYLDDCKNKEMFLVENLDTIPLEVRLYDKFNRKFNKTHYAFDTKENISGEGLRAFIKEEYGVEALSLHRFSPLDAEYPNEYFLRYGTEYILRYRRKKKWCRWAVTLNQSLQNSYDDQVVGITLPVMKNISQILFEAQKKKLTPRFNYLTKKYMEYTDREKEAYNYEI